ncbi:RING-type E3 ubiquitin transferase [Salvia divinorum]|uniref:RING-type E3 ubiquitin transferase n=1 Tax=Salvia divinorum TaxID=28513 RepID=A0ABD1FHW8_SALDI
MPMMDVNDNTRSNVTEPPIGVHVGENLEHDHEIDQDRTSYEQFQSVGDGVGHENKGLCKKVLSKLPTSKYKNRSSNETEECVICSDEFKKGDKVITLPCKHFYHSECITKWLEIKKHCPLCQREVKPERGRAYSNHNYGQYGEPSNHIDVRDHSVEHYNPGHHGYRYGGSSNHVGGRNVVAHYHHCYPGLHRYGHGGSSNHVGGRNLLAHYNPELHEHGHGESSNHVGESSNHVGERNYVEYHDYDSWARAAMTTSGVNDDHSPPDPSSLDDTIPNQPQFYDVGNLNKGLSKKALSKLPSSKYKIKSSKDKEKDQCVICCVKFKNGDKVTTLPCKHFFHSKCILKWLEMKKHCPLCQREVKRK